MAVVKVTKDEMVLPIMLRFNACGGKMDNLFVTVDRNSK